MTPLYGRECRAASRARLEPARCRAQDDGGGRWCIGVDRAGVVRCVRPDRISRHHLQPRFLQGRPCGVWPIASIVVIALSPMLSTVVMQDRVAAPADMHGAGTAQRPAAAELSPGHAEHVA
jgi:hypothetical protein